MTRIITYSLCMGMVNSNQYYKDITAFAETWSAKVIREIAGPIVKFQEYRRLSGESNCSEVEYAFELLVLGVLLREHGGEAAKLPGWSRFALKKLVTAQGRWPRWENLIKNLRGWVGWIARRPKGADLGAGSIDHMVVWLRANGEDGRSKRLAQWQDYAESMDAYSTQELISLCLTLANDFASASQAVLGKYTEGVDHFLTDIAPKYKRRYDAGLVSRTRLEYHLGMLGTEILNRSYRQRFLSTHQKVVILPPCMRAQPDGICKAVATSLGAKCQDCTPTCRVHQITKLGEKIGFEAFMIPEELRVFGAGKGKTDFGVVGVSCALTNWGGGWDTEELGIPAQGVLLDYVGCKYHWDEQGIPTDINIHKLLEVLGVDGF
jgi:hypothetical protein